MTTRATEQRNSRTIDIDTVPTLRALEYILAEEAHAVDAVRSALPEIAALVDDARSRLADAGNLHYFGAGASGRLAVLDATELTPTFGIDPARVIAHFPGGSSALTDSSIDFEDAEAVGQEDAATVSPGDVVVAVAASGATPYAAGALRAARSAGALTALVTNTPGSALAALAHHVIELDTGPEAITGSTRMKAGTATKMALNAFSTTLMVALGRTYSNLMVEMVVSNEKLRERAIRILADATGADISACRSALSAAGDRIPVALVSMLTGLSAEQSADRLAVSGGVRAAMSDE